MTAEIFPDDPQQDDEALVSTINTTPLVDIMLVLLIIFLITIPVVTRTVPVRLPQETNIPTHTKPENITIAVTRDGAIYWNEQPVFDYSALLAMVKTVAQLDPQPEIHIRGDQEARYEHIGKIVMTCQRGGISKVGFITEPASHGG